LEVGVRQLGVDPALLVETAEQRELRSVLREFLATRPGPAEQVTGPRGFDETTWARLAGELGVHGLAIPEHHGGAGGSFAELAVVLEETGRVLCSAPLLPTVVLAGFALLEGGGDAADRYLPEIAKGTITATVAGFTGEPTLTAELVAGRWTVRGTADLVLDGELVLARASTGDGERVFACEPDSRSPRAVLDDTRPQVLLEFAAVPAIPVGGPELVAKVLDIGRAGLAAEQVGGTAHALDATISYVRQRKQFGRPIGSFQAVQHRLADLLVQLEAARSASAYATACVVADSPDLPIAASAAAVVCSAAFQQAAAEYVQLHGGIGFTWEHPAHRYVRRARSDEVLLGNSEWHRRRVAASLAPPEPLPEHQSQQQMRSA
jgi:acyl-CoA dehydrogenase